MTRSDIACPCGSGLPLVACCGRYLDGREAAATAEALMRSRYTAYALEREDYLLATWHTATRPQVLNLAAVPKAKWLDLEIRRHVQQDSEHALVEFVARYKVNGRAYRLHEISSFLCQDGRWFYVDGTSPESA